MKYKTIVEIRNREVDEKDGKNVIPKGTIFEVDFVETFRNDEGTLETLVWIKDAKTIPVLTITEMLYFCVRQAEGDRK